jgi:hypothetical protein
MSEPDRPDIARRHRIPHLADALVGTTAAELEADAAAKAALPRALGHREPEPSEPASEPIEGLPPADLAFDAYTPEHWRAVHAEAERNLAHRPRRDDEERKQEDERLDAEAKRTDAERHADLIVGALGQSKREQDAAFIRSIHGGDESW